MEYISEFWQKSKRKSWQVGAGLGPLWWWNTGCFFFNWDPPKNHKYGKKLKYLNWDPPKSSKCQPVSKFWHLELLWWDLLCNLTLRTFWGGPSSYLEILGGSQFECSTYFIYRKTTLATQGATDGAGNPGERPQLEAGEFGEWDHQLWSRRQPRHHRPLCPCHPLLPRGSHKNQSGSIAITGMNSNHSEWKRRAT